MRVLRLVVMAVVALAVVVTARALSAQSTFSSASRTVAVYATVADAEGRLMPELLSGDFEVYDNGKRQTITVFGNGVQPITLVMLLDRSRSMVGNFLIVERAAEAFVNAMSPDDKARIGSFSNRIEVDPRDFTTDHDELLRILREELQEPGPTPLWNAVNVGITALSRQEGRRVILVFTDGMDEPGNGGHNNSSLNDVMKRADEENVMVYAIGLAGWSGGQRGGYGGRGGRGGGGGFGWITGPLFLDS
jgi:VWFA-related protein